MRAATMQSTSLFARTFRCIIHADALECRWKSSFRFVLESRILTESPNCQLLTLQAFVWLFLPRNHRKKLGSASVVRNMTQTNRVQDMIEAYRQACARMEGSNNSDSNSSSAPDFRTEFMSRLGLGEWRSSREVFANNELNMGEVEAIGFGDSFSCQSRTSKCPL